MDKLLLTADVLVSPAEAIDQPGWSVAVSSPESVPCLATPGPGAYSTDAVMLTGGAPGTPLPSLTVTVPGAGLLTYHWKRASGDPPVLDPQPGLTFWPDALPDDRGWFRVRVFVESTGPRALVFTCSANESFCWLDGFQFEPGDPISAATGAPELVWTSGNGGWQPSFVLRGDEEILALTDVPDASPAWAGTIINGPGRFRFTATQIGAVSIDGMVMVDKSGPLNGDYILAIPAGRHAVRWSSLAGGQLMKVSYAPSSMPDPLADALDAPDLPWLAHDGIWTVQSTDTRDGVDALTSNAADPGLVWASTVGPYPDSFRYWQKGNSMGAGGGFSIDAPISGLWQKFPVERRVGAQVFLGVAGLASNSNIDSY